jgi:YidC/Oxa1 family membrane protein insertase
MGLAFLAFLLWQAWQTDYGPKVVDTPKVSDNVASTALPTPQNSQSTANVPAMPALPNAAPQPGNAATSTPANIEQVKEAPAIAVETDVYRLLVSPIGGNIIEAKLKHYPVSSAKPNELVTLLNRNAEHFEQEQSGLLSTQPSPTHQANFTATAQSYALADGAQSLDVPLTWSDPSGISVVKTLRFTRNSYLIKTTFEINNATSQPWTGVFYRQLQRVAAPKRGGFFPTNVETYSFVGAAAFDPVNKFDKFPLDKFATAKLDRAATGGWTAMLQHHFLVASIPSPSEPFQYQTEIQSPSNGIPESYLIIQRGNQVKNVPPGSKATFESNLYVGPKLQNALPSVAPGLELAVDYGMVTVLAQPLFKVMNFLHGLVRNWGWAIILLTILVRTVMYPIVKKQFESGAAMKRLAPKIESLKQRFGDDRQKMAMAQMELFKKEGVNPMGGCLPALIQLPVFLALYWVVLSSVELRQAPFIGWIHDLTAPDPFYVLPIINAAVMFITSKITPMAGVDETQKKIMQYMPLAFAVMFALFPAGLVLYWCVNGLLGLAQQLYVTKKIEQRYLAKAG